MVDQTLNPASENEAAAKPSFGEAVGLWLKVGLVSFGGPAAQIAILHDELVTRRRWVDERTYLTALNYCMLLPGPEAQQLATFMGLRLHGLKGALAAGGLFILPGALVLFALAWLAAAQADWPPLEAAFRGLLPVVLALVVHAVWRMGKRTLATVPAFILAALAFVGLGIAGLPFPLLVGAALLVGIIGARFGLQFAPAHGPAPAGAVEARLDWGAQARRIGLLTLVFVVLWLGPVGALIGLAGPTPYTDIALFFTKAAFVTFGGAYAVLPYVADQAVEAYGWLSRAEMVQGLALAETTPGPLILVTQFVGFFAGWNAALEGNAGGLGPLTAATLAAALTTWVTFLPSFWFILAGAPLVEHIARNRNAHAALSAVSAAAVGVIATLALVIAQEALITSNDGVDVVAIIVALAAFAAAVRFKVGTVWLVAAGAGYGIVRYLVFA